MGIPRLFSLHPVGERPCSHDGHNAGKRRLVTVNSQMQFTRFGILALRHFCHVIRRSESLSRCIRQSLQKLSVFRVDFRIHRTFLRRPRRVFHHLHRNAGVAHGHVL